MKHLKDVGVISLNRCYCQEVDVKCFQLHVFANASELSYGSCIYLRCEHESSIHCNLVSGIEDQSISLEEAYYTMP